MASRFRRPAIFCGLALVLATACVELTGQRISWYHDLGSDELRFVIAYDGIHDNPDQSEGGGVFGTKDESGPGQIGKFIAGGDVMIVDWFGHLEPSRAKSAIENGSTPPKTKALLTQLLAVKVEAFASYRDSEGHVGALQRVVIPNVTKTLELFNQCLCERILGVESSDGSRMPATEAKIRKAAEKGFTFLALDGQALVVTLPYDRNEWQWSKRAYVRDMIESLVATAEKDAEKKKEDFDDLHKLFAAAASLSIGYTEEADTVRFVIGDRDRPNTLRVGIHSEYETNLEPIVESELKRGLDGELVNRVLGGQGNESSNATLDDLLLFGPPEITALALARTADDAKSPLAGKAREKLAALAKTWNEKGRLPRAPTAIPEGGTYTQVAIEFARAIQGL